MHSCCPCCSQKPYEKCCKPFHDGALPSNAKELMRSRFSAYAMCLPAYIISSTDATSAIYEQDLFAWAQKIVKFCQMTTFQNLKILNFKEKGDQATVTFIATLLQNGVDASFKEESLFKKRGEKWFYSACLSQSKNC